ncbi:MAG: sulfurtransferase [Pseudonocardia sp.]
MIPPFLSPAHVAQLPNAVLADLGSTTGDVPPYEAFRAAHLPGAVFVDLDRVLSAPPGAGTGRHPLPDPEVFAEGMCRAGIADTDAVIAYDRVGGVFAARLVWMLRVLGLDAAVLDGGPGAWPGEPESGDVSPPPSTFTARPFPPERLADFDEVVRLSRTRTRGEKPDAVLLDARDADRYAGVPHPLDTRSGHIPGARSLPCREHVDADGWLLHRAQLRARLEAVGVNAPDTPVVSSCGSGVTACHTLLVMEHVGVGAGRLYPGSWSQWSASDQPIAVGGPTRRPDG